MHLKRNVNLISVSSHASLNKIKRKLPIKKAAFSEWTANYLIPNWLLQRAYLTPDKTALSFNDDTWSFLELKNAANTYAKKLAANGLYKGDRIALLGSSSPEMVMMIHASMLMGLEIVMLNSRLTAKELSWQLNDSKSKTVIASDDLVHLIKEADILTLTFTEVKKSNISNFLVEDTWESSRTITIMYTSGTTGYPKGVRQTAGNHTSSALSSVLNLGLDEEDVWLCVMPLFHISGFSILVRSVLYGMEVRLYEKFDEVDVAEEIRKGSVTRMSVVTTMLDKIIRIFENNGKIAHPSFRTMLAGGGPVAMNYLIRAQNCRLPVLQTYGMTETSSQTATLSVLDAVRKSGSAGKPLFFNQIKISTTEVAGEYGEVCIRGPHVTPGYIGHFENNSPLVDGWLPTGDIGYFDEEGYLYIVDRRADLIISGGENVYPAEIENVLLAHDKVLEVGVCGQDDLKWGSVPVAFIVCSEAITIEEIEAYSKERLARYKIPKSFYFVDELPRNAANKLLRRELKKLINDKQ